eukprot:gene309-398_t
MSADRTFLDNLGKFKLVEQITKDFSLQHTSSIQGIGDDAAVIDVGSHYALLATDLLVEGVHFDLTYCPLQHVGYKAVISSISDILAMNGVVEQLTVGIALSNRFTLEAVQALYQGIYKACEYYQIDLVGGDTTSSATGLVISVTAVGKVLKEKVTLRTGAKPHDLICVTGDLGAAYVGLQILHREKKLFEEDSTMQPKLAPYQYVIERHLKPEARAQIVQFLDQQQIIPSSMIDVSNGLASELLQIGKSSNVGLAIYENKLPIDSQTYKTAEELRLSPTMCALHGGEDYELLFTVSQSDLHKIEKEPGIHLIGYITEANQGIKLQVEGSLSDCSTNQTLYRKLARRFLLDC